MRRPGLACPPPRPRPGPAPPARPAFGLTAGPCCPRYPRVKPAVFLARSVGLGPGGAAADRLSGPGLLTGCDWTSRFARRGGSRLTAPVKDKNRAPHAVKNISDVSELYVATDIDDIAQTRLGFD